MKTKEFENMLNTEQRAYWELAKLTGFYMWGESFGLTEQVEKFNDDWGLFTSSVKEVLIKLNTISQLRNLVLDNKESENLPLIDFISGIRFKAPNLFSIATARLHGDTNRELLVNLLKMDFTLLSVILDTKIGVSFASFGYSKGEAKRELFKAFARPDQNASTLKEEPTTKPFSHLLGKDHLDVYPLLKDIHRQANRHFHEVASYVLSPSDILKSYKKSVPKEVQDQHGGFHILLYKLMGLDILRNIWAREGMERVDFILIYGDSLANLLPKNDLPQGFTKLFVKKLLIKDVSTLGKHYLSSYLDFLGEGEPMINKVVEGVELARRLIKVSYNVYNKLTNVTLEGGNPKEKLLSALKGNFGRRKEVFGQSLWGISDEASSLISLVKLDKKYKSNPIDALLKDILKNGLPIWETPSTKLYNSTKDKLPSHLLRVDYKSWVEKYFANKGYTFDFDTSKTAPKLAKQLKKSDIPHSQDELIAISEFKAWLTLCLATSGNGKLRHSPKMRIPSPTFLVVDTQDFSIPWKVDDWAFAGSCNNSSSDMGRHTHLVLKHMGFSYLKFYNYTKYKGEEVLEPYARTYFYESAGGNLAHAGTYSNGRTELSIDRLNYTAYQATSFMLCVLFNKQMGDFKKWNGISLENDTYMMSTHDYDEGCYPDGHLCFWTNISEDSDYSKYSTDPSILDYVLYEDLKEKAYEDGKLYLTDDYKEEPSTFKIKEN